MPRDAPLWESLWEELVSVSLGDCDEGFVFEDGLRSGFDAHGMLLLSKSTRPHEGPGNRALEVCFFNADRDSCTGRFERFWLT